MPIALRQRHVARVLFDERHSEAWTVRPELAAVMQPEHPAASSYAAAARALDDRDFEVAVNADGPLDAAALAAADVLVIAHPSERRWERTVDGGSPVFTPDEIEAVAAFVAAGGGLVMLGETEEDKYGSNLNDLLGPFGLRLDNATVADYTRRDTPMWVMGAPATTTAEPSLLHLVDEVCFYRAGTITADDPGAVVLETSDQAHPPAAALLAAVRHGDGRVVAAADSDLFSDDFLDDLDHLQLWLNLFYWVAAPAFRADPEPIVSEAAHDPAWARLRDETNALRLLQEPKGEIDLERHDRAAVDAHVAAMVEAIAALAPRFAHESEYLAAVRADLQAWVDGGCGKPDFTSSLGLFRPEQHRRDGIEHLVVFPMYTPNGSPDTRFEALLVRTPWPEFIGRLERGGFDNDKYVPVQLIDYTAGYDSECAVLFPETVSVAGRPTNNYGGIFCDREASRFQRSTAAGAEVLRIDLPPDAAALVSNGDLVRETYILWDMVHDRWHSHGDLPFDPFMIRQRLPYWMYSLEELRVDLATYGSAGELARDGFPFARYVQYAILFDRILRFPITGNRVRNYDGLGGQLLFAYLHQNGLVRWTDNHLLIDWERIEDAVGELREQLDDLYRRGIDLSKVSYWLEAHDLVGTYVRPNVASSWRPEQRVVSDEADTRAWIDRVLDDEFPLSMFYETLNKKLAEELVAA
ncbi:MAG TPA: DUF6421 family protein [Thermoleophilia bacterium]|nr:DUF6421 family protein [Thermoleophilia bacterium]